uniref:Uncharacterized protein n=1 Tax=Anguilla anguilla TaxID=7936 RepID=A0A0E9QBH7_ANGAN
MRQQCHFLSHMNRRPLQIIHCYGFNLGNWFVDCSTVLTSVQLSEFGLYWKSLSVFFYLFLV